MQLFWFAPWFTLAVIQVAWVLLHCSALWDSFITLWIGSFTRRCKPVCDQNKRDQAWPCQCQCRPCIGPSFWSGFQSVMCVTHVCITIFIETMKWGCLLCFIFSFVASLLFLLPYMTTCGAQPLHYVLMLKRTGSLCTVIDYTAPITVIWTFVCIHLLTELTHALISSIVYSPWWLGSVCCKRYQIMSIISVSEESKNPVFGDQLSGATASAFYRPQSMYSCLEKRDNILAARQGFLTAFHSVVFLLYMTYSIF